MREIRKIEPASSPSRLVHFFIDRPLHSPRVERKNDSRISPLRCSNKTHLRYSKNRFFSILMSALQHRGFVVLCVLGLGLALASCDQGGGVNEDLSPDEAEARIETSIDALGDGLGTLEAGDFSTALKDFLGLQNGEATSEDWAEALTEDLDSVFSTDNSGSPVGGDFTRLRFDESKGEYAWNAEANQWVEQGGSDSVILRFPASEGATSNNATFEMSQYSDTPVTVDGSTAYLPTSGAASIRVDGTEVFAVDLSGASYTTEEGIGVPIPQSFSLEILTAPHTHAVDLNENSSTDFDFSFDLSNGDQLVAGLSIGAQLATDNYDELEGTDVEQLSGEVRISSALTVPYTIEVGELAVFDNPTEEQINNRIDATVQYQGQQIATLRYDEAAEEIEVVYSDGTVDPASVFYNNFLEEMESVWGDYLGNGEIDLGAVVRVLSL